ncbi:hypothetical protein CIHG_08107 [Coccidioides immitis H538.4]|uniref:Programmed cell death protein 2 C-terminal domain-containing protein n=1 Tax=Coccidioides immitis H538.4 TaxID=396776 RepID=A0A0J8URN8_COCIT|nr:hypothetical protein CIHG_08107 [Coccidioides immitis H538.4]
MDPYDSDSSGLSDDDAQGDYTETSVLLGYAADEESDDTVSHIGGWPTWLDPSTPPPGNFAKCKSCKDPMPLLLQLNADLPEHFPNDERWLYIFGYPPKPQQNIGAALFGVAPSSPNTSANSNPFSTSSTSAAPVNPFAQLSSPSTLAAIPPQKPVEETTPKEEQNLTESFADKVRLSSPAAAPPTTTTSSTQASQFVGPAEPWPSQTSFPTPYPQHFLDAEYETLSRPSTPSVPANVQISSFDDEGSSAVAGAEGKDTFESSLDKSFLKFSTRLNHNPEQVLRYEFRGTPLLYSTTDPVGKLLSPSPSSSGSHVKVASSNSGVSSELPRCSLCGRERVFELQLVPHAITVLEAGREGIGIGKDEGGMEWGTIIVGVCSGNCGLDREGEVGWREEWVGVQWEERVAGK